MKKNIHIFSHWIFLTALLFLSHLSFAQTINIYAAPNGDPAGNGQSANLPVSLDRATAIAKANQQSPCMIWLTSGVYSHMSLDASDTRSASAPVTYQAIDPAAVIFQPEMILNKNDFAPIPDDIKARIIDPVAKTRVRQLSLASGNFPDMAEWPSTFPIDSLKSPKFYKDGYPLPLSRYPSDTTMTIREVVNRGSAKSIPGGSFKYRDDRAKYWRSAVNDGGLFLSGTWQYSWEMDVIKTLSIDTKDSLIVQAVGILEGIGGIDIPRVAPGIEPYYALNLVEEIKAEGQWSINFKTKMLYMWVPSSGTITCAGNSRMPAISLTGVSYTRFIGITIRGGSGNGIELNNCSNVLIAGSHISFCSRYGVSITNGSNCTVQSNDIDSVGAGGVIISSTSFADDQFNVRSSGHQVINNHIYSFAREAVLYSAAVDVTYAIGTYVAYNKIHGTPHVGVLYGGNNNILEYNEVYDVVKKYTDMGAFYIFEGDRGWSSRGNKLHHNYIHDSPLANGIYQDDCSSGDSSSYNIIANMGMATFNHSGYFNAFVNNVYIANAYPLTCLVEPPSYVRYATHYSALQQLWNSSAAYKKAYPECTDMVGPSGRNNKFTSRIWPSATGNVFISNLGTLSNVGDNKLFNMDGTTNAAYAETGDPFVKWNIVFKNNIKVFKKLLTPVTPFRIDSLRSAGGFEQTGGHDWHVNRIGLHKDIYRTDISSTATAGIDPVLSLKDSSNSNYLNPGTVILKGAIKSPNAENILSSVKFFDAGKEIKGISITKKALSFDSAVYEVEWINPPPGVHQLTMHGYDSLYWDYTSNTVDFTVKGPPVPPVVPPVPPVVPPVPAVVAPVVPAVPLLSVVNDPAYACEVDLQWTALREINVNSYQILSSTDSVNFKLFFSVDAACNDSSNCSYSYPLYQSSNQVTFYKLNILAKDGSAAVSNLVRSQIDCGIGQLSLFPNPANNMISIDYLSSKGQKSVGLMVYDILGRVLLKKMVDIREGLNKLTLPLNNMADGVYLLVLDVQNNNSIFRRFIIQH